MSENSKIEWTTHTFNPWWGCVKVSPACAHCYAEAFAKRVGQNVWGVDAPRRFFGAKHWEEPLRWNRVAAASGERARVFCASMADVFEAHKELDVQVQLNEARAQLWALIKQTPSLDWLLLTKRPENIRGMLPADWDNGYPNVWLGTTVENQEWAEKRIVHLLRAPAVVHFLSCEPLLGDLDIRPWLYVPTRCRDCGSPDSWYDHNPAAMPWEFGAVRCMKCNSFDVEELQPLKWVICGGESGHGARPMHPAWAASLRSQCVEAGVPFFFKQWGDWYPEERPGVSVDLEKLSVHQQVAKGSSPGHYTLFTRVGKKVAGRSFYGREWNEMPEVSHA